MVERIELPTKEYRPSADDAFARSVPDEFEDGSNAVGSMMLDLFLLEEKVETVATRFS